MMLHGIMNVICLCSSAELMVLLLLCSTAFKSFALLEGDSEAVCVCVWKRKEKLTTEIDVHDTRLIPSASWRWELWPKANGEGFFSSRGRPVLVGPTQLICYRMRTICRNISDFFVRIIFFFVSTHCTSSQRADRSLVEAAFSSLFRTPHHD